MVNTPPKIKQCQSCGCTWNPNDKDTILMLYSGKKNNKEREYICRLCVISRQRIGKTKRIINEFSLCSK